MPQRGPAMGAERMTETAPTRSRLGNGRVVHATAKAGDARWGRGCTMQVYEKDLLRPAAVRDRRLRRREKTGHDPEHAGAGAHAAHHLGSGRKAFRLDGREDHLAVRCRAEEKEATGGAGPAGGKGGKPAEAGRRRLAEPARFRAE